MSEFMRHLNNLTDKGITDIISGFLMVTANGGWKEWSVKVLVTIVSALTIAFGSATATLWLSNHDQEAKIAAIIVALEAHKLTDQAVELSDKERMDDRKKEYIALSETVNKIYTIILSRK